MDNKKLNKLTKLQIDVTRNCGTEPAFDNQYWNHKEVGLYVDIISGEPLFCSKHKFNSGTGWPSFYELIDKSKIVSSVDFSLGYERTEIKAKKTKSHLGHVFKDGPSPTGLRYCINSASLKFIPYNNLTDMGYGEYLYLFEDK